MKMLTPFFVIALVTGCGGGESKSDPARPSTEGTTALLKETKMPEPLMRTAVPCCSDLKLEKAIAAYTKLVASLGESETNQELCDELTKALEGVTKKAADFEPFIAQLKQADANDLSAMRTLIGELSEVLLKRITASASASGALDLAFGYSRDADRHWAQEGVEPKSPYGDGINSYSWGSRDEVKAIDKEREEQLGNNNLGANP